MCILREHSKEEIFVLLHFFCELFCLPSISLGGGLQTLGGRDINPRREERVHKMHLGSVSSTIIIHGSTK